MPHSPAVIRTPDMSQADAILEFCTEHLRQELGLHTLVSRKAIDSHTAPWLSPRSRAAFSRRLDLCLRLPDSPTFLRIVAVGEQIAGLCIGRFASPLLSHHSLDYLQLDRSIRRRGIGTQLVQLFEASACPTKPIGLTVLKENTHAQSLYRKLGYQKTGTTTKEIGTPPEKVEMFAMYKNQRSTT